MLFSPQRLYFILCCVCVYAQVHVCVHHVCVGVCEATRGHQIPVELELYLVVSC